MNMIQRSFALVSGLALAGAAFAADVAPTTTTVKAPVVKTAKKPKNLRKECIKENPALKGDKAGLKACVASKKQG